MSRFLTWISTFFLRLFSLLSGSSRSIYDLLGDGFVAILQALGNNWIFTCSCSIVGIICLIANTIADPNGAINTFMKLCIDLVVAPLPSTPSEYKFASLVAAFDASFPFLGSNTLKELLEGVVGLSVISLSIRVVKYLPFF